MGTTVVDVPNSGNGLLGVLGLRSKESGILIMVCSRQFFLVGSHREANMEKFDWAFGIIWERKKKGTGQQNQARRVRKGSKP